MSVLGIGAPELLIILLLVVVVLGPDRAKEVGTTIGRFLRRLITSQFWREMVDAVRFMQQLPQNLVKMAELEEVQARLTQEMQAIKTEVQQVTRPIEAITPTQLLQQSMQGVQADVREALSLKPAVAPAGPTAPAAAEPSAPAAPETVVPAEPASVAAVAESPAAPAAPVDGDLKRTIQELARYAEEWPLTMQRLAELERAQARMMEELRQLQEQSAISYQPSADS